MTETRAGYTPSLGGDADGNDSLAYHDAPGPPELRAKVAEVKRVIRDFHAALAAADHKIAEFMDMLQAALTAEQQARFAAEQDCQHWQERAEALQTQVAQLAEALDTVTGVSST